MPRTSRRFALASGSPVGSVVVRLVDEDSREVVWTGPAGSYHSAGPDDAVAAAVGCVAADGISRRVAVPRAADRWSWCLCEVVPAGEPETPAAVRRAGEEALRTTRGALRLVADSIAALERSTHEVLGCDSANGIRGGLISIVADLERALNAARAAEVICGLAQHAEARAEDARS